MPGPWLWYAREDAADDEGYSHESPTREAAIESIAREVDPGTTIKIVEARMSTDKRYEGADLVPFTHRRNAETIELGGRPLP